MGENSKGNPVSAKFNEVTFSGVTSNTDPNITSISNNNNNVTLNNHIK